VRLKGHELLPEIHAVVSEKMMRLCEKFLLGYPSILKRGTPQRGKSSYFPRRRPEDSRSVRLIDRQQFNQLRVVNNKDYPATFVYKGAAYILKIEKKII